MLDSIEEIDVLQQKFLNFTSKIKLGVFTDWTNTEYCMQALLPAFMIPLCLYLLHGLLCMRFSIFNIY